MGATIHLGTTRRGALQCPDDFATCAVSCNPQQNTAFAAYAACIVANDCASKCDAEK